MSRLLRALLLSLSLLSPLQTIAADFSNNPPAILLASVYRDQVDVAQFLASEKLDGVRAVWDGQNLRFRSGRAIHAPGWFIDGLPKQALDGELWLGRGRFEQLSGIVRREVPDEAEWRQVRYMIFELPGAAGPFSERASLMQQIVGQANLPYLQAIEQFSAVDRKNLQKTLKEIVAAGGEGLVLHRATAVYESGRSETLLKMKPVDDAEAVVIGHLPGKGKHAGALGALRVRSADGREFSLGSGLSDAQRRNPPAVGATVTYRYRDLTRTGLPRFATFLRVFDET